MKRSMMVILLIGIAAMVVSCKNKETTTSCIYGNDIPDETRGPILRAGEDMVQLLQDGKLKELYETGTKQMKIRQNRDQFAFTIDIFVKAFGPVDYARAEEVYFMESTSQQEQVWISCNLGEPGVADMYGMPANKKLAVVIYKARTDLEIIRVIFQLEKLDDKWKLRSMALNPATIKHKLPDYFAGRALKYRERNLLHLTILYYKTAIFLSDVGVNVNEVAVTLLQEQMRQIKVDYMPAGQTQIWTVPSGAGYKVYNVDAAYHKGNHLVHLSYMTESLEDKQKLEKQARELAEFTDKKFPEYRIGFDGIKVTAASEKAQEQMMAYHSLIMFDELTPETAPETDKKTEP